VYLVSYTAFSVPAVIAGIPVTHYGLRDTATVYAGVVIALALTAAVATELTLSASERGTSADTATGDAIGRSTQPEERTNRRSRRRIVSCRFSKRKAQPTRNIEPITNGPWHLQYS
jgi:hypothetical protein